MVKYEYIAIYSVYSVCVCKYIHIHTLNIEILYCIYNSSLSVHLFQNKILEKGLVH